MDEGDAVHTDREGHRPLATLLAQGDAAWTVEFGAGIDPVLQARVLALADRVRGLRNVETVLAGVLDVVPTFRSLTVLFDPLRTDAQALGQRLLAWSDASALRERPGRCWRLPVCFAPEFAPDLADLSAACGRTGAAVVELLTSTPFRVGMIGFMPGFPYMTGLPPVLARPRLATPRKAVPARSLAVAGTMCGVYPWESPGGWRLLGRTPLPLFDLQQTAAPAWLAAGDEVRWQAVDRATHDRLAADWAHGAGSREAFLVTPSSGEVPCPAV
jgi:KipI family sensor histidine kinase inhibitor